MASTQIDTSMPMASTPDFHLGWQEWLAENLMSGVEPHRIAIVLSRRGFADDFIDQKLRDLKESPVVRAGKKISGRARKMQTLLAALSKLYRASGYAEDFAKVRDVTPDAFYKQYFFANRPIVLQGLMKGWKALETWTPEYFAEKFGDSEVEITSGRNSDPRYEDNFTRHRSHVRMRDYVQMLLSGGETNDFYLVAKNYLLTRKEFEPLFEDFACPEGFMNPDGMRNQVKLWLGPKGTITPLHHDACNILFGQIYGRKQVKLISPFDLINIYNDRECYTNVDLGNIDYEKFPLMRQVSIIDVVLEPGEFILLPIGWWHWVRSLDISISLSMTNFRIDGPQIVWGYRY